MSDVHIQDGLLSTVRLPYTPGHEMAGVVCRLGEGVPEGALYPGQHVVCAIDITCGHCRPCRIGRKNLCLNRVRIGFERDGSHEEYAVVPYENLLPIDSRIPFAQAAIIPDAVACMYHAVVTQGKVSGGDRVLFYGTGALGLQGVQIARHCGAEIYAAARTQAKLEKALEFGAHAAINTKQQDLYDELMRLTDGDLCDVIFDLVGNADTIDELLRASRRKNRRARLWCSLFPCQLSGACPSGKGGARSSRLDPRGASGMHPAGRKRYPDTLCF